LSNGYSGGTGNGTAGMIDHAAVLINGDLIIGGHFTSAGGYQGTSYFSCYQWSNGWSGVGGKDISNPPDINGIVWGYNTVYQLQVIAGPATVYGPTSSGGFNQTVDVPSGSSAYWNEFHDSFAAGWWSVQ